MRTKKEAQASVIGTIMAIMVILAFMALITEQYVPLSMMDYEAEHMKLMESQYAVLKQVIDTQIMMGETNMTLYVPITLGSKFVPVFTTPTGGVMNFAPYAGTTESAPCYMNLTFTWGGNVERLTAGGCVYADIYNRYYVRQNISYEMGAIALGQPPDAEDQVLKAKPHISMSVHNTTGTTYTQISITLISLVGENYTKTGTGPVGLNLRLLSVDTWTYRNVSSLTLVIKSIYSHAWYVMLQESLGGNSNVSVSPPTGGTVTVAVSAVDELIVKRAVVDVSIEERR